MVRSHKNQGLSGAPWSPIGLWQKMCVMEWAEGWNKKLVPPPTFKKASQLQAGNSVTTCSYAEADDVLFTAFPDAQKSTGAANKSSAKTAADKKAFKANRQNSTGQASYHMDYKTNSETGVLYGHENLPDGYPHKTIPHINVVTPDGEKADIFVNRPVRCK